MSYRKEDYMEPPVRECDICGEPFIPATRHNTTCNVCFWEEFDETPEEEREEDHAC